MLLTRSSLFAILAFLLVGFVSHEKNASKSVRWIICGNSSLVVNGSTNLSRFSCAINGYPKTDTIKVERNQYTKKIALSGRMGMAIAGFDCKNRMMTNELRKTLKQDLYPEINIEFVSINGLPELDVKPIALNGVVDITIAGVKKRFDINYTISVDENKEIRLLALRDVNFSDFGLVPPKKLGRLVQAKNKLGVVLDLKMKVI
jgi:hypothetical protein